MIQFKKTSNVIYPEWFKTKYIYGYKTFNGELEELIETSGYKIEFARKFRRCLTFLEDLKRNCTKQKSFERLTNSNELYSMRLKGEKNIRILFSFFQMNGSEVVILLYSFQEKNAKNSSKDSYRYAIDIAKQRMDEIRNE